MTKEEIIQAAKASATCQGGVIEEYEVAAFLRGVEWAASKLRAKADAYDRMMADRDYVEYE